jgi:hypothetical protein
MTHDFQFDAEVTPATRAGPSPPTTDHHHENASPERKTSGSPRCAKASSVTSTGRASRSATAPLIDQD